MYKYGLANNTNKKVCPENLNIVTSQSFRYKLNIF